MKVQAILASKSLHNYSEVMAQKPINEHVLYIALWHHRHGVDTLPFLVPEGQVLTEQQVIDTLGDEFEPDRNEWIDIRRVEDRQIIRL